MRLRTIIGALSFTALVAAPQIAEASSHREAPFVSRNPKVDGTDFYAFESYETGHQGMVTFIANYQPLQDAYGAPNYFALDPNAVYEIEIDNNGDGVEDLTFSFQFKNELGGTNNAGIALMIGPSGSQQSVAVPFYNVGLIPNSGNTGSSASLNVTESYSVNLLKGPRRAATGANLAAVANPQGGMSFNKPADNVGAKSFGTTNGGLPAPLAGASNYAAYAKNFIYSNVVIPGCAASDANKAQIFVGQRAESFAVNLGPIFDLVDAPAGIVTGGLTKPCTAAGAGVTAGCWEAVPNPIATKNITTIAIEVPADCIAENAMQPVIGAWTTAAVPQARVLNPAGTYALPSYEGGALTEVSRLGNPLVNEVVIGIPGKDLWNNTEPSADVANFGPYVEYPTLPAVIDVVFGTNFQPTVFPRTDLVATFLQGIGPLNAFPVIDGGTKVIPAEMIHLNVNTSGSLMSLGVTTVTGPTPSGMQNRLGAALCVTKGAIDPTTLTTFSPLTSCDPYGFPNGRRPIDDVVDLALDVVEGYLLKTGNPAYSGTTPVFFTDAVDQGATAFDATFPYLTTPTQGANGNGT